MAIEDSSSDRYVIGMDGGGTGTTCWLADETGQILGRAEAGPSNFKAVGVVAARDALDRAAAGAFEDAGVAMRPIEVACLGLAGFDRAEDRDLQRDWLAELSWAHSLILVNDCELVVAAGTPSGVGVGVIAGTGSIAMGIDATGRRARAGGWGFLFGDEGSGYAIALAALRRVARQVDGRDKRRTDHDILTTYLCDALKVNDPTGLVSVVYHAGFDRACVAALAPVVIAAMKEDPALEVDIIEPAGRDLADLIAAVAHRLDWLGGPLDLAMAGGFLLNCIELQAAMCRSLTDRGFSVTARGVENPVEGAVVLARRTLIAKR